MLNFGLGRSYNYDFKFRSMLIYVRWLLRGMRVYADLQQQHKPQACV